MHDSPKNETDRLRIGVTFNAREAETDAQHAPGAAQFRAGYLGLPGDDEQEEFDSPETIAALAAALGCLGHEVELLGDGEFMLRRLLDGARPELVWNFAEGIGHSRSREARVPSVLEMLGIPYTGSDPLTLATTLDKDCAKRLVASHGVATPAWHTVDGTNRDIEFLPANEPLRFPLFVKPAFEGSSKGILATSIIHDAHELQQALAELADAYCQPVLVEEFVDGDELTVGLIGNGEPDVLGVMRVVPRSTEAPFVYSLEVKRDYLRRVDYECPARLSARDMAAVRQAALTAWHALGCRDVARIDFRLRDGVPYFLEANPLPGLSPESGDLVLMGGLLGIEHRELVARILHAALDRLGIRDRRPAMAPVLNQT
jgi:D-alanine-D-alanine ligase